MKKLFYVGIILLIAFDDTLAKHEQEKSLSRLTLIDISSWKTRLTP